MNNIQIIKIARSIVALDAKRLRTLQGEYDDEYGVFDEVVSEFEQLSDLIEGDSSLEENRSFWDKLFNKFDPDKISESIITHVAGGLFVRAFKLLDKLAKAENNRQEVVEKFEDDAALEKMTKKELSALLKEIRNQKKLLNNFEKNKEALINSINTMSERTESLKRNDKLKDIARNQTIKDFMSEINQLLNEAAELIDSDRNIGEIADDISKLDAGYAKIKKNIEQGKYVREQSKTNDSNPSPSNVSIQQKLTSLESDSNFDVSEVKTMLTNFSGEDGENAGAKIAGDIGTKLNSNKNTIVTQTGRSKDEIDKILINKLYDGPNSIKQKIKNGVKNLNDLLDANKLTDFYNKIKEISQNPNNYFKLQAFNQMFNEFGKKSQLKNLLIDSFKQYDCKPIIDEIKTKFEEIVNNYNPVSLRVTRTSSLNKIARRIAESYK